jgi:RHS repeat-associated protein
MSRWHLILLLLFAAFSSSAITRQTLSWDACGRLHSVTERDASNSGYNWTAMYDGFNRRLSTTSVLVTNGVAFTSLPTTINSYYDPQVEFLELGLAYGKTTEWKLYGPDLNGKYGGMNGTGGFDGVSPYLNTFYSTISDCRGNILGEVTNGVVNWFASRPTGYGAVPGYRPLALGSSGASVALSSAWRGRWMDITGYHQIGLRPYDPVSGRWLTYDSVWNERDPNYYSFAGGDPVNGFDADGRCVEGGGTATGDLLTGTANLVNNTLGATAYALSSSFAPDWSYQNLGGYAQNLANTVTGAAQFGYNVAATATYGAISPFAPDVAYNNYGGNVQQLMGQAPGFYGGNGQSLSYQIGYGAVTVGTIFTGNEAGEVGNLGKVGEVSDVAADVSSVVKTTAADSQMVTVLGSGRDVAQYVDKPGFNTFTGAGIAPAELDTQNALWLNAAIQRGDTILEVTDPAIHQAYMDLNGWRSAYLNLELPMVDQYESVNVIQAYAH